MVARRRRLIASRFIPAGTGRLGVGRLGAGLLTVGTLGSALGSGLFGADANAQSAPTSTTIATTVAPSVTVAPSATVPNATASTPTSTRANSAATAVSAPTAPPSPLKRLALVTLSKGLIEPVDVAAPLGDGLLFVVERAGVVRLIENGRVLKEPFANLRSVVRANSIEQGLLGIAFHPKYPTDRRVFLFHSIRTNDNVLVSYTVAPDGRRVEPGSRSVLLTIDKEATAVRHNAGALRFGPDGLLYVAVGDAARAKDNGQNTKTLPGSILRVDIDGAKPYAIPTGNPFADGKDGRPELWWYGLRNPWRFSIDAPTGLAYIGDVGQETIEEVNVVPLSQGGLNLGWPLFQGTKRYLKGELRTPVVAPVVEVRHNDTDEGCSITGGEVYRGTAIPELVGHYFYADWCNGWIRSFRYDPATAAVADKRDWSRQLSAEMVSAFGHDRDGELLVVDYAAGTLSRVVPVR